MIDYDSKKSQTDDFSRARNAPVTAPRHSRGMENRRIPLSACHSCFTSLDQRPVVPRHLTAREAM